MEQKAVNTGIIPGQTVVSYLQGVIVLLEDGLAQLLSAQLWAV